MTTSSRLLWRQAGRPTSGDPSEWYEPHVGRCWWCGLPSDGLCRTVRSLPSTFPPLPPER
jgi:hypothetical protein